MPAVNCRVQPIALTPPSSYKPTIGPLSWGPALTLSHMYMYSKGPKVQRLRKRKLLSNGEGASVGFLLGRGGGSGDK